MNDPEYIVLVALDTPSKRTGIYISGGVMAAPTVGAVLADILPYLGVERSYSADDLAGQTLVMPDLSGKTVSEADQILKQMGLSMTPQGNGEIVTGQVPAAGQMLPGGSHILAYFGNTPQTQMVEVPNFMGMDRQNASDVAGKLGLYLLVGVNPSMDKNVKVTSQTIAPGTVVPIGTMIQLDFTDTAARD